MRTVTHQWRISHIHASCPISRSHFHHEGVMSHMNKSCHLWMRTVTHQWRISNINASCPIWRSHVPNWRVMSHMNRSCHIWMSFVTYDTVLTLTNDAAIVWVMSHTNGSCHTWTHYVPYQGVMSHMKESWHIWMGHIWMRHVTCGTVLTLSDDAGIESTIATLKIDINFLKVYEWVALQLSDVWMSHVYEWDWIYNRYAQNTHQLSENRHQLSICLKIDSHYLV